MTAVVFSGGSGTGPSGARLAPDCDRDGCDGYHTWPLPGGGSVDGHCGCFKGRATAEADYANRHGSKGPS